MEDDNSLKYFLILNLSDSLFDPGKVTVSAALRTNDRIVFNESAYRDFDTVSEAVDFYKNHFTYLLREFKKIRNPEINCNVF